MKYLNLSVGSMVLRFYLMMLIIIVAGFTGLWFLSLLALPVFFSALMGIQFKRKTTVKKPGIARSLASAAEQHHPVL